MGSKFFVISTVVFALVLVASVALVDSNQDSASGPAGGQVLGLATMRGILNSKQAAANGTVALVVVVSSQPKVTFTVNTSAATRFTDRKGVAISVSALAAGHALEITGVKQRTSFVATLVKDETYVLNRNKVEVSKNTSPNDGTVAAPTGMLHAVQAKVASFIITAPISDDALVSSVVLSDASSACSARYVENIVLRAYTNQQLSNMVLAAACPSYTFKFSPGLPVRAGTRYVVDVLADLEGVTPSSTPLFTVEQVNAISSVTGNDMSIKNLHLPLQTDYIAGAGILTIQTDSDSPIASNYLMGSGDQVIAKFKLSAGQNEAVRVKQLTISFLTAGAGAGSTVKNIRLFDISDPTSEKQIGITLLALNDFVPGTSSTLHDYKHATFYSDDLSIPAGMSRTLALKVDFASYLEGGFTSTGQIITPVILSSIGSVSPIVTLGASSSSSITPVVVSMGVPTGGLSGSYGAAVTLYRAKLTVSWFPDTPAGGVAPASAQVVGKILVTNLANAGLYLAQIKYFNVEMLSTFATASGTHYLNIYKDSLNTTALGQAVWSAAPGAAQMTNITDSAMLNVDIATGASKTFFVTLDTTGAPANGLLSIRLPQGSIHWSDGLTDDISVVGNDLPLTYKTMSY